MPAMLRAVVSALALFVGATALPAHSHTHSLTHATESSDVYQSFAHVFGEDRLLAHFPSEEALRHSLRRATHSSTHSPTTPTSTHSESSKGEQTQPLHHLACGHYRHGRALKLQLEAALEVQQVRSVATVFSSHSQDRACFTVTASSSALAAMDFTSTPLVSLEPVPKSLKIHQSVVFGMNKESTVAGTSSSTLSAKAHIAHQHMAKTYSKPVDLSKSALVVSSNKQRLSTSTFNRIHASTAPAISFSSSKDHGRRLKERLLAIDDRALESLTEDISHAEHSMWTKAFRTISTAKEGSASRVSASGCAGAFSELQFDTSASNRVTIRNLQSIREAVAGAAATQVGLHANDADRHIEQFSQACFVQLLAVLADDPESLDIRFRHPQRKMNHVIKGIVQAKERSQTYPYLDKGLDGLGQVVGLADTGVDEYSCFFSNDDGSVVARSSYSAPTFDLSKRKVIQYIDYQDGGDGEEGHGSHCSGSVLGLTDDPTHLNHSGHAEGAKLAFFDMENTATGGFGFQIDMEDVLNCAYSAGAKLSSNSYGGMSNDYDDDTLGVDAFSNDHDDYLALFAAGNEGDEGYYSLSGASIAKNSVGVGASESMDGEDIGNMAYFSSIGPTFDNRIKPDVVAPGHKTFSARSSGALEQTCEVAGMSGTSMATPATTGVAAQIRQYFEDSSFWETNCAASSSSFVQGSPLCSGGAFSPRGATVKALLVHSGEPMLQYNSPIPYCYGYGGDEPDEPDACATCNGVSFGDCVTCKEGYEINVYYADCSGWCVPVGDPGTNTPEHAGCEPGEGYSNDEAHYLVPTREPGSLLSAGVPDMYQGFGRIALPNVLPLTGVQESIQLYVGEFELNALKETSFTVTFTTPQSVPLKVTLCWMDPTNSVISAKLLLHDIDLVIESAGQKWYGNKLAGDERNNVEQITIDNPPAGEYKVSMISKVFTESATQKVSLTVTAAEIIGSTITTVDVNEDFVGNELSCASDEAMLTVILLDNYGDGWLPGSSFDIKRTSDGVVVWTTTMSEMVTKDAHYHQVVCVPDGEYEAVLVQVAGDDTDHQMGVEIDGCFIHLSATVLSQPLSILSGVCNSCSDTVVNLALTGSPFSIPYGWKDDTQYVLTSSRGRVDMGRLVMGINMDHHLCLPNAEYHLRFDSVAESDDWIDDQSGWIDYADVLGIGEYLIIVEEVNTGNDHAVEIDTTSSMTIRVHDNTATVAAGELPFTETPSSEPSAVPLAVPSSVPSLSPSTVSVVTKTVVSFSTSVGMTGIAASSFDSAANDAFAETTASGINGVNAEDISNIVAVDNGSSVQQSVSTRALTTGSVTVTFVTTAVRENMPGGYADSSSMVTSIESSIASLYSDPATGASFVSLSLSKGSAMPADTEVVLGTPVADHNSIQESVVSTRSPTASSAVLDDSSGGGSGVNMTAVYVTVGVVVGVFALAMMIYAIRTQKKASLGDKDESSRDDLELAQSVDKNSTENPLYKLSDVSASGNL